VSHGLASNGLNQLFFFGTGSICQTYQCRAGKRGALLSLPYGGHREDVIRAKVFEDYIKDNVDRWFYWSKKKRLHVERMEDLILVTGYTLATSWAAAVFDNYTTPVDTSISLRTERFAHGGAQFFWSNIHGNVKYYNSHLPVRSPGSPGYVSRL
jgi:hypothetical protein